MNAWARLVAPGLASLAIVGRGSPMTPEDHVLRIAIFAEENPLPNVARFELGPRAGRACPPGAERSRLLSLIAASKRTKGKIAFACKKRQR